MNLAVLFNEDLDFNPHLDPQHPVRCIEIGSATSYDPGDGHTYTIMSMEEYEELKARVDIIWAEAASQGLV